MAGRCLRRILRTTNAGQGLRTPIQIPVALARADKTSGNAPLTVNFSSAGSHDPDGTITAFRRTFGHGATSTAPHPAYTYAYAGTYTVTLTVTDNNNVSSSAGVLIAVAPNPSTILRSTADNLSTSWRGKKLNVDGEVVVKDGNQMVLSGATVTIRWTKPDHWTVIQAAQTGNNGVARFSTSGEGGIYTLTVTDIYKTSYTFDRAGSLLSATTESKPRLHVKQTGSNVGQAPIVSGANFTVTLQATGKAMMFRLFKP